MVAGGVGDADEQGKISRTGMGKGGGEGRDVREEASTLERRRGVGRGDNWSQAGGSRGRESGW